MSHPISIIEMADPELTLSGQKLVKQFFNKTATIIYSGQRPLSSIYIHSGEIIVLKKNKTLEIVGAGNLLLSEEFKKRKIIKVELVVAASSLISWVGLDSINQLEV